MSRCVCCDNALTRHEIPQRNPETGKEDDFCFTCRYLSKFASPEREYVGGAYPVDGVTAMKSSSSDY